MRPISTSLSILLSLALFAISAQAQDPSKAVTARGVLSVDKVRQGGSFQGAVVLDIDSTFHINSNRPTDPNLIPTKIELVKIEGITFGPVVYPKGENQKFKFSEQPLSVYSEHAVIKFPARASAKLPIGAQTLRAKLSYQACNNQACFPPKTIEVAIPVEVVDAKTKVSPANEEVFGTTKLPVKSAGRTDRQKGK